MEKDKIEGHLIFQPIQEPITKREYFAAMAMQGIVGATWITRDKYSVPDDELIATYSTEMADALLKELNK